jgi:flagellar biosynthesis component FlhA
VLLIAVHIYVVRFMPLPTGKSISYLMLLASAAVELACLHTVYRMMSVLIGVTLVFYTMPLFNKSSNNNKKDGDYSHRKETKKKEDRKESKKSFKSKSKQQNNK